MDDINLLQSWALLDGRHIESHGIIITHHGSGKTTIGNSSSRGGGGSSSSSSRIETRVLNPGASSRIPPSHPLLSSYPLPSIPPLSLFSSSIPLHLPSHPTWSPDRLPFLLSAYPNLTSLLLPLPPSLTSPSHLASLLSSSLPALSPHLRTLHIQLDCWQRDRGNGVEGGGQEGRKGEGDGELGGQAEGGEGEDEDAEEGVGGMGRQVGGRAAGKKEERGGGKQRESKRDKRERKRAERKSEERRERKKVQEGKQGEQWGEQDHEQQESTCCNSVPFTVNEVQSTVLDLSPSLERVLRKCPNLCSLNFQATHTYLFLSPSPSLLPLLSSLTQLSAPIFHLPPSLLLHLPSLTSLSLTLPVVLSPHPHPQYTSPSTRPVQHLPFSAEQLTVPAAALSVSAALRVPQTLRLPAALCSPGPFQNLSSLTCLRLDLVPCPEAAVSEALTRLQSSPSDQHPPVEQEQQQQQQQQQQYHHQRQHQQQQQQLLVLPPDIFTGLHHSLRSLHLSSSLPIVPPPSLHALLHLTSLCLHSPVLTANPPLAAAAGGRDGVMETARFGRNGTGARAGAGAAVSVGTGVSIGRDVVIGGPVISLPSLPSLPHIPPSTPSSPPFLTSPTSLSMPAPPCLPLSSLSPPTLPPFTSPSPPQTQT
ncbi:unnamed protein product, partial [Closterium sp. NIES-53]